MFCQKENVRTMYVNKSQGQRTSILARPLWSALTDKDSVDRAAFFSSRPTDFFSLFQHTCSINDASVMKGVNKKAFKCAEERLVLHEILRLGVGRQEDLRLVQKVGHARFSGLVPGSRLFKHYLDAHMYAT